MFIRYSIFRKFCLKIVFLRATEIQEYSNISIHIKYIADGLKKHSIGLYTQKNKVYKLLSWDIVIFLNSMRKQYFAMTFSTHLGNTESLVFIRAWRSIFSSETVVTHKSTLYGLGPHDVFIVAQVMPFRE